MSRAINQERRSSPEWTPEENGRLLELQAQGFSTRQISAFLGRTSSSVTARAYRIKRHAEEAAEAKPSVPGGPRPHRVVPLSGSPARLCQYIGEDRGHPREWTFCGKPSVEGRSYCAEHTAICYIRKDAS